MLDRLVTALGIPGVDGVLGTPDVIEDLLLLGALDDKFVFGSMNRGGLPGAVFEMDDRFTCYTPQSIVDVATRRRQDAAAHQPRGPGDREHAGVVRATPSPNWPPRIGSRWSSRS